MARIALRQLPDHAAGHGIPGSSPLRQEVRDAVNTYGGATRQTFGVPIEEIVRGVSCGVREVMIATDCSLAMTAEFRRLATPEPDEFDPRKFLKPGVERMRDLRRLGFQQFSTAGQAGKIKVLPMSAMAKRYGSGALDPRLETGNAAE